MISPEVLRAYRSAFRQRMEAQRYAREELRARARQAARTAIVAVFPHYPAVRRAYLFGSVTRPGAFGPRSDVDIGLEGGDIGLCLQIWRDLEKIVPAWQFDVRLLDDDWFAERTRNKGELVYERATADP